MIWHILFFWGRTIKQTFFLIFRCRPQTLPPRNATQGKISSGSDFILEPCDSQSQGWQGWAEMAGGGSSAQKNEHLIVIKLPI